MKLFFFKCVTWSIVFLSCTTAWTADDMPLLEPLEVQPSEATLAWQFVVKQELRYRLTQRATIPGRDGRPDRVAITTLDTRWVVTDIDSAGTAAMRVSIERVQYDLDGGQVTADTAADPGTEPHLLARQFAPLMNDDIALSVSPQGTVTWPEANDEDIRVRDGGAGTKLLRQFLTVVWQPFPEESIGTGHLWHYVSDYDSKHVEAALTYQGYVEREGHRVEVVHIRPTVERLRKIDGLVSRIVTEEAEGRLQFDCENGRLVAFELEEITMPDEDGVQMHYRLSVVLTD